MLPFVRLLQTRWLPFLLAFALAFYGVFIARTRVEIDGTTYFTLFDDAMISLRYARNLAEGFGLTWNPGEVPVEGYTNFAWTLALAAVHRLGLAEPHIAPAVMALGAALLIANVLVVRAIARQWGLSPGAQAAACALVAFCFPLVYWTLRGMEVGALALLVDTAVWLALALRARWSAMRLAALALMLATMVLVRMDALISAGLVAGFVALTVERARRVPAALTLAAAIAIPLAGLTAFRVSYYHDWLPATYYLKVTGVSLIERLTRGAGTLAQAVIHSLAPVLAPVVLGLWARRPTRDDAGIALALALFVGQAAYSIYVGGDAWEWMNHANRYVTVALPMLMLAAVALWERVGLRRRLAIALFAAGLPLASLALERRVQFAGVDYIAHPEAWMAVVAVAAIATALGAWLVARGLGARPVPAFASATLGWLVLVGIGMNGWSLMEWARENAALASSDAAATRRGLAIRRHSAPDTTIAVAWAGSTPYYARRTAIDLLGKCDPVIAKGPPARDFYPGHNKWNYAHSVGGLRPDVIVEGYHLQPADLALFASLGYTAPAKGLYLQAESRGIDAAGLAAAWRKIPW